MQIKRDHRIIVAMMLVVLVTTAIACFGQDTAGKVVFKQEELEQILAPIALYSDSLLSQVLMASTYPLEIVRAARWATENKSLTGDALAKELEKQPWDPSVKSLVNFPDVLTLMNEKLDWTQKVGDAMISQQKDVLDTIQKLRAKAQGAGNLKTTKEQTVIQQDPQTIVIEPADPEVVYVPAYDSTEVYGAWSYPSYPPYSYYPGAGLGFLTGVAIGSAWGYAWGGANWHGGDIDVDVNRNRDVNRNINRGNYASQYGSGGRGGWRHDSSHRGGVAYRDQATARQYNRAGNAQQVQARDSFRGRSQAGFGGTASRTGRGASSGGAFQGMDRGRSANQYSSRGQSSRSSMQSRYGGGGYSGGRSYGGGGRSYGGGGRSYGGGGGGRSYGGGGGRGGGGRGGGGRGGGGRGGGGRR